MSEEATKDAIAAVTKPQYKPDDGFGGITEACTVCGHPGSLLFCPGTCRRCFHAKCMGASETASFLSHEMCSECAHGKPVLQFDPTLHQFFFFKFSPPSSNSSSSTTTTTREEFNRKYSEQQPELKVAMRNMDEDTRKKVAM